MRVHRTSAPLLQLATTLLLLPQSVFATPNLHSSLQAGFAYNQLFARYECDGTLCGYSSQLCCGSGSACYTNALTQAACSPAGPTPTGGYWQLYTTTFVQTDLQTVTSVMSSYVSTPAPSPTAVCNYAINELPCGSICCSSGYFCYKDNQCAISPGGGSSGYYSSYPAMTSPGAPLRPTSSGVTYVTTTSSPTITVPFEPPVATGANVTITANETSGGGLSGGAIAGIVIGVLVAVALLALLCFYCCIKGMIDGLLACFGLGKRRRRTTEVEEYERRSHHTSRTNGGGGGGRTWYGAVRPPARVQREERRQSEGRTLLGIGAGLAALWAILGLKRRHDNQRIQEQDRYSEYTYSSDYYTSASSASSDRRTRDTRRSRAQSRR